MPLLLHACIALVVLLGPQGGYTSGSTIVHQDGKYYRITLATPSLAFATDPGTGRSGESENHARARRRFEELLTELKGGIERNVETLRTELEKTPKIVAYDSAQPLVSEYELEQSPQPEATGPCRMSFAIHYPGMGSIELSFASPPPSRIVVQKIQARVSELFSPERMAPP